MATHPPDVSPIPVSMSDDPKVAFLLTIGEALHHYGAPAHRLEESLGALASGLGLEARFYSTPTAILASFGPVQAGRTCMLRIEPGEPNLEKIADLDEVVQRLERGEIAALEGLSQVKAIVARPDRHGIASLWPSAALASGSASVFFGGGAREIAVAAFVGFVVAVIGSASSRARGASNVLTPVSAAAASALSIAASRLAGPLSPAVTTLAGVIALVPGLSITVALTELSTRNLASGTARLTGAMAQLIGLAFGAALGARVGAFFPPSLPSPPPQSWPLPALGAAVLLTAFGFSVILQARPRDTGWVLLSGAIAFAGTRAGALLLGPELGAFVSAFVLTFACNLYTRVLRRPATIPLVPGLLLLVPGSLGLRGVMSLVENEVVGGVDAAFHMLLVAAALAAGLLVANVALPPRRAL